MVVDIVWHVVYACVRASSVVTGPVVVVVSLYLVVHNAMLVLNTDDIDLHCSLKLVNKYFAVPINIF